ncbi:MAG: DUF91 domain-containing protein [Chloroflexi bacterium]|nr:DUF91 domain-containing protein [Chloroflexota bacterium]MYE41320.1 DUF91 domain-containing protein [Chloroflexota bacterium]
MSTGGSILLRYDKATKEPEQLPEMDQFPYESDLTDILVKLPAMLEDGRILHGLILIARELVVPEGGKRHVDLLGVDSEGRLCLFEVKRSAALPPSVGQLLMYAAHLEKMSDQQLAIHLSEYSGAHGTTKIHDFTEWYHSQPFEKVISQARPTRLFLVGVKADAATIETVEFLGERGIDISLITLPCHRDTDKDDPDIFVGSSVIIEPPRRQISTGRRRAAKEKELEDNQMRNLEKNIRKRIEDWPDLEHYWESAKSMLEEKLTIPDYNGVQRARFKTKGDGRAKYGGEKWAWADYRLNYQIWGNSHSAVAIEADPFEKIFRVMFFGIYVDLCKAEFEDVAIRWHDRQYKFSTWDPHLHRIGHGDDRPVTFPRCLGKDEDKDLQGLPYCPEIKFEFRSKVQWDSERESMGNLASCVLRESEGLTLPLIPTTVVDLMNQLQQP